MGYRRLYRKIYAKIVSKKNPLKYAKKIGVNIAPEAKVYIYGQPQWGTEPWLITIGDNVYITAGAKFVTHDGGTLIFRNLVTDLEITKPITVGNNVYFGNNVTVLPGVTIGDNVVVGTGAIVTRDIPSNSVAAGVPAKVIKPIDEYFEKLKSESLHLGHLKGEVKDRALMEYFGYKGNSKGIYF